MNGQQQKCVRAIMSGRVQGVWFRAWTVHEASQRGLRGWVRNRRDGSVEAVFAGPDAKVDDMIRACHDGPPHARVAAVDVEEAAEPVERDFRTVPSA